MRLIITISLFLGFGIFMAACHKEEILFAASPNEELELPLIIDFDRKSCFFDEESNSFRYSIGEDSILNFSPFVQFQEHSTITINDIPLANNMVNNLGTIKINENYAVCITTNDEINHFTLSFTTFPIIRIVTRSKIKDNPKLLARLSINYPTDDIPSMNSFIEIDYRGSSSQKHQKKSYGFSFLEEMNIGTNVPKGLLGWAENEDWILDAAYKDQAKFRNKVSFEIWKDMNPTEHIFIQSEFVEVFLNNSYEGLYSLNEQINPEKLDLEGSDGALYKSVAWSSNTYFKSLSSHSPPRYTDFWDDWEQKHPDSEKYIKWQSLYDLRDWVINDSDQEFIENVSTHIDLENFIDYYLFINLVGAHDNHGKNILWLKADDSTPFSIIPWDIDASWGRDWDSSPLLPVLAKIEDSDFFKRLLDLNPDNLRTRLKNKWNNLRASSWTNALIKARLDKHFDILINSGIIHLENERWRTGVDLEQERIYIHNWLTNQYTMLDLHFNDL